MNRYQVNNFAPGHRKEPDAYIWYLFSAEEEGMNHRMRAALPRLHALKLRREPFAPVKRPAIIDLGSLDLSIIEEQIMQLKEDDEPIYMEHAVHISKDGD